MDDLADAELIERIRAGKTALYETLIRYNQRLYRIARVLRSPEEAEDVIQEAYVRAYTLGRASISTRRRVVGPALVDGGRICPGAALAL